MMNCQQFLESLDCYIDGELSAGAAAAADAHRRECHACRRVVADRLALKGAVRQTVVAVTPPPDLEDRVRHAIAPHWWQRLDSAGARRPRPLVVALTAVVLAVLLAATIAWPVDAGAANAMDLIALRLDDSHDVVLEGTVLCRDCELQREYGVKASCPLIGHHGAIATADGRIWNIVEQQSSERLIHDDTLLGRKVVVRGRMFRGARALVIESYLLVS